ncbi:hypothetical protein KC345_g6742 [Hortaea werneckii]|nr:hypothetical protein KC345_g6742 [Hortaea werneckii]
MRLLRSGAGMMSHNTTIEAVKSERLKSVYLDADDDEKQAAESSAAASANANLVGVKPGTVAGYSSMGNGVAYDKETDTLTVSFGTAGELAAWMEGNSKERMKILPKAQMVVITMALGYDHVCLSPDGGRAATQSLPGTFTAKLKSGGYSIKYTISRADRCNCFEDVLSEDADDNNEELKVVYQAVRRAIIKRSSDKATVPKYATSFELAVVALTKP